MSGIFYNYYFFFKKSSTGLWLITIQRLKIFFWIEGIINQHLKKFFWKAHERCLANTTDVENCQMNKETSYKSIADLQTVWLFNAVYKCSYFKPLPNNTAIVRYLHCWIEVYAIFVFRTKNRHQCKYVSRHCSRGSRA